MTGDEAVAFIDALLPSGVVGTQAESQVGALDERTGPFFDAASLLGLLQVSAAALTVLVQNGDVLAVVRPRSPSLSGIPVRRDRAALAPTTEVLAQLDPSRTDPWGDAVWLNAPGDDLTG